MNGVVDLNIYQMISAYIFVLILLFIVKLREIPREKEILISTIRMTIQLVLTGYILGAIFNSSNPIITLIIIGIMEIFAIHNIFKRTKAELTRELKRIIGFSMLIGTLISLFYFLIVVVRVEPWYDPRYFIPLGGMVVGNSMTGISLGIMNLMEGFNGRKDMVETALMLGATPKMASRDIVNNAFDSAILPTINSMVGMGIIFLPGMMTGQILSGTSPLLAIRYQIAIMLGIMGSVSLTVILFLQFGYKTFFTKDAQLIARE
ncbi:MAG TPA: iron export ABC transporter permease subunit FetB [Tissierellales bacterium]|nr:iron export ABC transporter permease subunit FetB [Tissierellales bacterium]